MMTTLLLDSTVWLAAKDADDTAHDAARAAIRTLDHDLAALDLTLYEVANVCVAKWHDPAAADEVGRLIRDSTGERLIRVDDALYAATTATAQEHGLSGYDAAYAAAARLHDLTLVSIDSDLLGPGLAIHPAQIAADTEDPT